MNPLTVVERIQNINSKEASLGISEEASWHDKCKDLAYLFVCGIPGDLTEDDLITVFAEYGKVVDVNLARDKFSGKSQGHALLAYEDEKSANLAVDYLDGAKILGKTIGVFHFPNYKKKEGKDEETEMKKREERGVCRAFQRGECTRGVGCKFSYDQQRAAKTVWAPPEDANSKWDHDKFDGHKKEKKYGKSESNHIAETRNRDLLHSRVQGSEMGLGNQSKHSDKREKILQRYDGDKFEGREGDHRRGKIRGTGEYCDRREDKQSGRGNDDDMKLKRRDHRRREDIRLRKPDDDEFEPRTRDSEKREEKRHRRQGDDDFGRIKVSIEILIGRQHREYDSASRSREDYNRKQWDRSNRLDTDRSESKVKYDSDGRDKSRSRR